MSLLPRYLSRNGIREMYGMRYEMGHVDEAQAVCKKHEAMAHSSGKFSQTKERKKKAPQGSMFEGNPLPGNTK